MYACVSVAKHVKRHLTRVENEENFPGLQRKKLLFATHLKLLIVQHPMGLAGVKDTTNKWNNKNKIKILYRQ
jgi:hypothetical protein